MDKDGLQKTLFILLIVAVLTFLVEKALQIAAAFGTTILLFALAWLVAFTVGPLVTWLTQVSLPAAFMERAESHLGTRLARWLSGLHLSRGWAAMLIYLGVIVVLVVGVVFVAPLAAGQLYQLGARLPEYAAQLPGLTAFYSAELKRFGLDVTLPSLLASSDLARYAQDAGTLIVQNALGIATSFANLVLDLFLVLILSFYMALDGPRIAERAIEITPLDWQDEAQLFSEVVGRTFGGFVRGQLLQALIIAAGTGLVMAVAGVNFVLLVSLMVGVLVLIPAIGPLLALLPPVLLAALQQPGAAVPIFLVLLLFQQIIINVLMPRLMSEMLGLHPLLVFAAILIGIRVAGIWGSLFGIPIAGVLASIVMFFYLRLVRTGHLTNEPRTPPRRRARATPAPSARPAADHASEPSLPPLPPGGHLPESSELPGG